MRLLLMIIACLICSGVSPAYAKLDRFNPKPSEGDFILPMPDGGKMVFRKVFLGVGDSVLAQKSFMVGDPQGSYKSSPTKVTIGGSFVEKDNDRNDWMFYIGKYEVSESQYYRLMNDGNVKKRKLKSLYPITNISYFDVQSFVKAYSLWLYDNAFDSLPKYGDYPGFIRLPTEREWEFAARGGIAVSPGDFDKRYSYKQLNKHEWFSGPTSSHNKLQMIGGLSPNPLGLHDMLGNVSEMTSSMYSLEYYQGKSGGFTARGGSYFTPQNKISAAERTEQPVYLYNVKKKTVRLNKQPTLGFRVVIATPVFPDREVSSRISNEWDEYKKTLRGASPAGLSVSPVAAKTKASVTDAQIYLGRLRESLSVQGTEEDKQNLERVAAVLDSVGAIKKKAEEDSAFAWAKTAADKAFFIAREYRTIKHVQARLGQAKKAGIEKAVAVNEKRLQFSKANIADSIESFGDTMEQLANLTPDAVLQGFARHREWLKERQALKQIDASILVEKYYQNYAKELRRANEVWCDGFSKLF
ncbi:SUMF1/EgtB/PvdO family nonheme iron enzyme [Halodesulfovibrio sp.]|uniref:formylglycine-generating enzyme family protein n=1 Tax=Halodesulfovibrio sp. TaxID=1912772 RepID=UPI0025BE2E58|nr:SUMF1/EgtB/PvdO family nonheme iron enzyme [Halodesulfovibrio sp.]